MPAKPTASRTMSTPGLSLACVKNINPAQAASSAGARQFSHVTTGHFQRAGRKMAKCCIQVSATASGVAPFCGPKTAEAPRSSHSGLSTSQATMISVPRRRGSRPSVPIRCRSRQRCAAVREQLTVVTVEAYTERARHAGTTVVGCAAADADDDFAQPGLKRGAQQFAGSECDVRGSLLPSGTSGSRRLRPFRSRPSCHRRECPGRHDLLAERTADFSQPDLSAGRADECFNRSFTAIGDRDLSALPRLDKPSVFRAPWREPHAMRKHCPCRIRRDNDQQFIFSCLKSGD